VSLWHPLRTPIFRQLSGYIASTTSPTVVAVVAPPGMPNSIPRLKGASTGPTVVMANACVEGFMVHLRNLIDFMWPTTIHDADVVADDFCAMGTWKRPINEALSDARTRVHKELAHLTSDRISGSPQRKKALQADQCRGCRCPAGLRRDSVAVPAVANSHKGHPLRLELRQPFEPLTALYSSTSFRTQPTHNTTSSSQHSRTGGPP
jgi:hypothetical protein